MSDVIPDDPVSAVVGFVIIILVLALLHSTTPRNMR